MGRLERYVELLVEWNEKINLVSANTLPDVWTRHILDSAQLIKYLPSQKAVIADMGSGAGFPGMVLAIMTSHEIHLIESIGKKAHFLSEVAADLKLNIIVHQERIEEISDLRADVVTARALKALPEALKYANILIKKDSFCLFLKGQKVDTELTEASKCWNFAFDKFPSLSGDSGCVLKIRNLSRRR